MYTSVFTSLAISLTLTTRAALAAQQQPACLLAAINTQPNPADSAAICGSSAAQVQSSIQSLCGADQQVALDAFADVCKTDGVVVSQVQAVPTESQHSGTQDLSPLYPLNTTNNINNNTNNQHNHTAPTDSNPDSALNSASTSAPASISGLAFDTSALPSSSASAGNIDSTSPVSASASSSSKLGLESPASSAGLPAATASAKTGGASSTTASAGAKSTGKSDGMRTGPVAGAGSIAGLVVAVVGVVFAL